MGGRELRHSWMGHIGEPASRMRELRTNLMRVISTGAVMTLVAILLLVVPLVYDSPPLWALSAVLWMLGLMFLSLGAWYLRRGTVAVARNELLTELQRKVWIKEGKLVSSIDDLLYLNNFGYDKARRPGYVMKYRLENGLKIDIARFSNVIQLLIAGIDETNAEDAKRLRRALDEIDLSEQGGPKG